MSLKAKTVLMFSVFTVTITFALAMIAAHQLAASLEEQFLERGKALAERVAKEAFLYLYVLGKGNLDVLVDSVADRDVLYLQIVKDGDVVAQRVPPGISLDVGACPAGFSIQVARTSEGVRFFDIKRSMLGRPSTGDTFLSYVRLGLSLAAIGEKLRTEFLWIGLGAGIMAVLGVGLAFLLYRTVLGPLEEIAQAMREFGQGRLSRRAPVRHDDEFGTLAREFNRMADAILEMKEELERANRAKSEFLTIMSHELRTPLHALLGYTELLLSKAGGDLTSEQRRYVEAIQRSGNHLLELLENALRFSKLELGVEKLQLEQLDCREVLREALEACRAVGDGHPEVRVYIPRDPVPLKGDRTKVRQILINLIANALRFARRRVEVELSLRRDGILIAVRDDGPGIPPEKQTHVFEPFVRGEMSGSREGLGLGLAIVKRYVEMHGGRVWLESKPGQGTTFYVKFPAVRRGRDADTSSGR